MFNARFGVKTLSGTLLGLAFNESRVTGPGFAAKPVAETLLAEPDWGRGGDPMWQGKRKTKSLRRRRRPGNWKDAEFRAARTHHYHYLRQRRRVSTCWSLWDAGPRLERDLMVRHYI